MRDLRVITAKAQLKVHSISPIRGFLPVSVLVVGTDLHRTTEVELNGILCDEYLIQDSSRLVVRVPDAQIGQVISSIKVFTPISTSYDTAKIEMSVGRPLRSISGVDRMVQAWLLIFFTNPGTDIFDQNSGGGARALIGRTTDAGHQSAAADLALCIDRTKTEMLRIQSRSPGLPLDERLMSSSLDAVRFDPDTSTLFASVSLRNMAGGAAQIALG